jgi:predicted permease
MTRILFIVLKSLVGADLASAIVGDLLEEHARRARQSRVAATAWMASQAASIVIRGAAASGVSTARELRRAMFRTSDLYQAIRALRRAPAFTIVALAIVALGVAASTTVYSVVDAVVLRPLPFAKSDRLVSIAEINLKRRQTMSVTPQDFADWRDQQTACEAIAAVSPASLRIDADGQGRAATTLSAENVTAEFFSILRSQPRAGRLFTRDDERPNAPRVAIISHRLWQSRFDGRTDAIGSTLTVDGGPVQVVGVMPLGFVSPFVRRLNVDVWMPLVLTASDRTRDAGRVHILGVIGRLRDGVSVEHAQADMDRLRDRLAVVWPVWFDELGVRVRGLLDGQVEGVRTWMLMLLGAVGGVLLIACVNVANLMLVRASARRRDLEIRAALGATPADLARRLLAESAVLAVGGTALGVLVAWWGLDAARAMLPATVPRTGAIAMNLRVLGAAVAASVATTVFVGLLPAWRFVRPNTVSALRNDTRHGDGRSAARARAALVTAEVALATMLLVGATWFVDSFVRLVRVDLGLDYHRVLVVPVQPALPTTTVDEFQDALSRVVPRFASVIDGVRALPGVESVAWLGSAIAPLSGGSGGTSISIPGRPMSRDVRDINRYAVSPEYFSTVGIRIVKGRSFDASDREGAERVVILNEAAARAYFGDVDPIDRIVELGWGGSVRVVGVAASVRQCGPEQPAPRECFVPFAQSPGSGSLLIRTASDPMNVLPAVKTIVWKDFPGLSIERVTTLEASLDRFLVQRRFAMALVALFGLAGLAIAAVGLYGVMAYAVVQRTRELGVRVALGAAPARLVRLVLTQALAYVASGLAIGLAGARVLGRLVESLLFQVTPRDVPTYAIVASILAIVGLLAALAPALRASRVDPVSSLRAE